MSPAAAAMADTMTERELLRAVLECARWFGWRSYHSWTSIHSEAGFPDVVLVKDGRLIFAELKTTKGKTTREQDAWLADLRKVGEQCRLAGMWPLPVQAYLWRPSDWKDGTIEAILRGPSQNVG